MDASLDLTRPGSRPWPYPVAEGWRLREDLCRPPMLRIHYREFRRFSRHWSILTRITSRPDLDLRGARVPTTGWWYAADTEFTTTGPIPGCSTTRFWTSLITRWHKRS